MGYKRAGFRMLGGVEIDPKMMAMYRANHHPEHSFLMGVQDFVKLPDDKIPDALRHLDVLDGSPPCSSFSTSGTRDKDWGTKKVFREGQAAQVLDDLFFDFIAVADRLRPKVVVAENVKGLIIGKARGYVKMIFQHFAAAGYDAQLFLLNASAMGVPQRRERTFFIARRRDLGMPAIRLEFNEAPITAGEALDGALSNGRRLTSETASLWERCRAGDHLGSVHKNGSRFSEFKLNKNEVANTVTGNSGSQLMRWDEPRHLSADEVCRLQTFPADYNFGPNEPHYVCGMSVPPFMMERVATQIRAQMLEAPNV
jgi:DNA (cytosine-5)-methyltransferase 1